MTTEIRDTSALEDKWIALSKNGDKQAFSALVNLHMERAVQIAYGAAGNYEDARDIAQESFVKAYHALKKFDGRSQFSTWFYRILMNTAKDFHRRKKWQVFVSWKSGEEKDRFLSQVEARGEKAEDRAVNTELQTEMQAAIQKLPEKQKHIFVLRYMEELSIREISEVLNLAEGTVKAAIHAATQKFKKNIEPYLNAAAAESQGGLL